MTTIYTDRTAVIIASDFISKNRLLAYIRMEGNITYYNVCGIIWEVYQDGCGNYPTTNNIKYNG